MKRKALPRRSTVGIALVFTALSAPLLVLAFIAGIVLYDDVSRPDELLGVFPAAVPVQTRLLKQNIAEAGLSLYLTGWVERGQRYCLGISAYASEPAHIGGYRYYGSQTKCITRVSYPPHSVWQFWLRRGEEPAISVAYGYSGHAARVALRWQDGTSTTVAAEHGVFMAVELREALTVRSLAYLDAQGDHIEPEVPASRRKEGGR